MLFALNTKGLIPLNLPDALAYEGQAFRMQGVTRNPA